MATIAQCDAVLADLEAYKRQIDVAIAEVAALRERALPPMPAQVTADAAPARRPHPRAARTASTVVPRPRTTRKAPATNGRPAHHIASMILRYLQDQAPRDFGVGELLAVIGGATSQQGLQQTLTFLVNQGEIQRRPVGRYCAVAS